MFLTLSSSLWDYKVSVTSVLVVVYISWCVLCVVWRRSKLQQTHGHWYSVQAVENVGLGLHSFPYALFRVCTPPLWSKCDFAHMYLSQNVSCKVATLTTVSGVENMWFTVLVVAICRYDPKKRLTSENAVKHPWICICPGESMSTPKAQSHKVGPTHSNSSAVILDAVMGIICICILTIITLF